MKAFSDLEQSKKLAEFLPLESVDMCYLREDGKAKTMSPSEISEILNVSKPQVIPCWSLAALLEEIPSITVNNVGEDLKLHIDKDNLQYSLFYENEYTGDMFEIETELHNNMIDACYELILKLNELKML